MNWRSSLRSFALLAALGLIGYGIIQPLERETVWLICLWGATPLVSLAIWLSRQPMPRGLARSVYNLGLVVAIGFGLLSMQLLRQQVVQSDATYNYVSIGEDGSTTSNVRPVLASQRILRGNIYDRQGVLLVASEPVGGFARRTYPLASIYDPSAFGNIVGYFSRRYGTSGLEAIFDGYLSGSQGDPLGRMRQEWLGEQLRGNDLSLTLNAELQARIAAQLDQRGRPGSVVVLDPRNGAVLAMVSRPGFDPSLLSFNPGVDDWEAENLRIEEYWRAINSDTAGQPLLNRPTQGRYPPGSTYKTLTAIAALEYPNEGQPNDIRCFNEYYPDPGAPAVINAVPNLASLTGDPSDLERVYAYSCNVAFAQYATRLGPERMIKVAEQFDIVPPQLVASAYQGFTDLPTLVSELYEESGFLNQPRGLADTGYGQGQLQVTPLQMAMVAAAVANDGALMRPFLVQKITRPDGSLVREFGPSRIRQAMSKEIAATMRADMNAVARYGFGSVISEYVPGINVGGKSGTAQHVEGATPHAWFIAIAPIENPRFAVAVMVESGGEGSSVAGRLAGEVLSAAFETE
jgi:penicillin-binding protein A